MNRPRIVIVAAVAHNGVIGKDGEIPWYIEADMHHFRRVTMGKAVVMGRRTWESIPSCLRPLEGRRNVVLTRNGLVPGVTPPYDFCASSLPGALERLEYDREPEVCVIGGAQVYAESLPLADELVLTEIDRDFEGDTRFPEFDRGQFNEVSRVRRLADDPSGLRFSFVTYRRRED
jgi:dihydrofolate reductase